jgi:formate C-acetyltransferase
MRQPNFQARRHTCAPQSFLDRIDAVLCGGANSLALYNDDVIVETLCNNGYSLGDARNYAICGCVEPVAPGETFGSTDAALFNLPIVLELALNEGRRFGHRSRVGARTPAVSEMRSMDDVTAAFERQLAVLIERLVRDLRAVELAHRHLHPTPLTSMLLAGCIENGTCSTAGGAVYNASGIQCVGPSDTGDSLAAIEQAVFRDRRFTLVELVENLKDNLQNVDVLAYLRGLGKFGNDDSDVDRHTTYAVQRFIDILSRYRNTRGGPYTTGLYSMTTHYYFGNHTGALPNGRRKGECFSSGIAPGNGMDRNGPTALFNSVNRLDFTRLANGVNLNVRFDQHALRGETGRAAFASLVRTYFRRGGMQVQVNVIDPGVLIAARDDPNLYPNLLVRISGYSAYFNDLIPQMKDEIIRRTSYSA